MTTQKQTTRHFMAIAAATLALLATSSIAQADGSSSFSVREEECDLDRPNCGEKPDYCDRHPASRQCNDVPVRCEEENGECGKPAPRPCGPNEFCRYED